MPDALTHLHGCPSRSLKITYGFIRKTYQGNAGMAKEMFFSDDIPDEDLQRWVRNRRVNGAFVLWIAASKPTVLLLACQVY